MNYKKQTSRVYQLRYAGVTWNAEIVTIEKGVPGSDEDLLEVWIYPEMYGVKEMIVGEPRNGRADEEIDMHLIDYLFIDWENPQDHIERNSFDQFMEDHPEDF